MTYVLKISAIICENPCHLWEIFNGKHFKKSLIFNLMCSKNMRKPKNLFVTHVLNKHIHKSSHNLTAP